MLNQIFSVCVIGLILASCGGGGSDSPTIEPDTIRDTSVLMLDISNDANSDGIRDEVNTFIDGNYSETSTIRDMAVVFARAVQAYGQSETSTAADQQFSELQNAIECIYLYVPENSGGTLAHDIIADLKGATFDTKERVTTYLETDALLSQYTYSEKNPAQQDCV